MQYCNVYNCYEVVAVYMGKLGIVSIGMIIRHADMIDVRLLKLRYTV